MTAERLSEIAETVSADELAQFAAAPAYEAPLILANPPELGWVRASDNPTRKV